MYVPVEELSCLAQRVACKWIVAISMVAGTDTWIYYDGSLAMQQRWREALRNVQQAMPFQKVATESLPLARGGGHSFFY